MPHASNSNDFIENSSALHQEQSLLLRLSEAIPSPVFYKDTDLKYIGCNKAFENFFQKDRRDVIGKTISDLYLKLPEKAQKIHERDRAFLESKDEQYVYESDILDQSDKPHHFVITKAKFYHLDGSLGGIVAVMFDNTERKHAENLLREKQDFLQKLIDSIPSLLFYKDAQLVYEGCNKAFEEYLQMKKEDIIGKKALDVHFSEIGKTIDERDRRFLASDEQKIEHEKALPDGKTGEVRDFFVVKGKYYNTDGSLRGIIANIFDITERKKLEQNLRQSKEEAENLHNDLKTSNEQLLDGIRHARHVQKGILLDRSAFTDLFPESFIFLKPKNIVSGDFYWFARKADTLLVAAVDCTGHGASGALMTVLGHTLLNQIVYEQNIFEPHLILRMLDIKLKAALRKEDSAQGISDGMELSLCKIDLKKRLLEFSGARGLAWHKRGELLQSLRSSKFSIEGYTPTEEKVFESCSINFEENDLIYLATDGFKDQLRSSDRRKFTTKQFEYLLADISPLSMEAQKEKLRATHENWCENFAQTDDILVMGIRLKF